MIIASYINKEEGQLPKEWYSSKKEAWKRFSLRYERAIALRGVRKLKWEREPEVIEHEGKFNVVGVAE